MTSYLNIDHVSITFPTDKGPLNVLDNVKLAVAEGEFISLIGHSGCGKSTVLNIVAGLLKATAGGIILEGREVDEPGPDRAVVFQNHSLLPWLSVYDNVRLAVDQVFNKKKSRRERDEWTRHNLELVHMSHALDRKPDEISGGMKQRVGIARALAMEPKVLLMDEPFGALDSLTRTHMQDSLMEIQARLNNTVIMITHDVDEAVLLSDRIVMMSNGPSATIGQILEIDLPRPRNRIALADDPSYNHYRAEVLRFLHERHQNPDKRIEAQPTTNAKAHPNNIVPFPTLKATSANSSGFVEKRKLALGFMPLTDCAPLVVALEHGFFSKQGLDVTLSRESSWANIRDKVATGMLDGAQMLAAMPLASTLNASRGQPMVTSLSLDLNGNAITVSKEIYGRMLTATSVDIETPLGAALALKQVIDANQAAGRPQLSFATVFPESSHNLLMRYWMASAGIDPDRDVRLIVVPPPQMGNYLRAGVIAGYCVGEPWNTYAVTEGLGRTLLTSRDIWNNHPEKVLGVTRIWAQTNPNTHQALVTGLIDACIWLDDINNRREACQLLSAGRYVNAPADVLEKSLTGTLQLSSDQPPRAAPDFNIFHRYAANFPWRSHALWFISQMLRWGLIDRAIKPETLAAAVYRPEVYRAAAARLGIQCPQIDYKSEGLHAGEWTLANGESQLLMGADLFMDGRAFDPEDLIGYLAGFSQSHMTVTLDALATAIEGNRGGFLNTAG